jgi:hypothetical protein
MWKLALSATVLLAVLTARTWADDLFPPPYRGLPQSTLQEWTFDGPQGPVWPANPGFNNPYAPPVPSLTGGGQWVNAVNGRTGLLEVDPFQIPPIGTLAIGIPDLNYPNPYKDIRVQVTWFPSLGPGPGIVMSSNPPGIPQGVNTIQAVGGGFFYEQLNWRIVPNPNFETLILQFPSRGYVDQIVVDTICVPEPATLVPLALVGLAALRRRPA